MVVINNKKSGNAFKKIMMGSMLAIVGAGAGVGIGYSIWHGKNTGGAYTGKYGVSGGTNHITGMYLRPDYVQSYFYVVSDDHTIDAITWGIRSDEADGETRDIPKQVHISDSGRIYWDEALDTPCMNFKMFVVAFVWHGTEKKEVYSPTILVDLYDIDGDDTRYEDNTTIDSYVLDGTTYGDGGNHDYEKIADVAWGNLGTKPTEYANPNTNTKLTSEHLYNDLILFVTGNIIENRYLCGSSEMATVNFYKFYNQDLPDGNLTTWDSTEGSARMNYGFNLNATLNLTNYIEGITDEVYINTSGTTPWFGQYTWAYSAQQKKEVWYIDFYEQGHKNDEDSYYHRLFLSYYYADMPGPDGI